MKILSKALGCCVVLVIIIGCSKQLQPVGKIGDLSRKDFMKALRWKQYQEAANFMLPEYQDDFVATFSDLSMLFFVIDEAPGAKNAQCIDFQGPNTGVFDYVITGGAGRFEGATGHVTVNVSAAWGVSPALAAEVGEIVGTIDLP